ncbi:deoxyribonuclease IV [Thermoactinomyces intermedius]|jgi:deoxyribonuclease IV|uniref:Probable endonuclease 4 n=1 Tax=Thermoactinomyces intermedius TaxID=2024 RepID=A0A8I1DDS5_THEIN|nr:MULTISPECIES: deoxyribonuclease IV [Thermoactinomyces]MBA4547592.1 deoxyribonuclease IV [Thermoactinomyces intermedius]MBA4836232.1 deoxyribonuclease IV [Thermoactinomyces intermedius]MBH8594179.1 deoxyribonuclease IV [Thermoactinomyces intermedius]MBH8601015.1 deoxyribonuclease IV [Thermoactinomyces sp. CICC 23799]
MKIGCHISVAKGFYKAAQKARELGADSFQVFTKNPRGLRPKKLNHTDAERGRQFCEEHGISLVCHTPYITNLSTPKPDLHEVTIRSIKEDLMIAEAYGAVGAVVHCGKHVGEGEAYGRERMVETLNKILADYEGNTKLLLENTAGQGSELGLTIQELVDIREATDAPEKIGFCFDTCHGFAAGIWMEETFSDLVNEMEKTKYLENLVAIHFNDSKAPAGSRKDRHEKIGKGEIGEKALSLFLKEPRFEGLPVVLETPVEDEQEYSEEMKYLHQLKG